MRLRDAKEQVEREQPELTGNAKLEAIKALRDQAEAERPDAATSDVAHCAHCEQQVKPVEKTGWRNFFAWLTLLQFGAVIAAIVAAFHSYDPASAGGGGIGWLILWPAAVHPSWLGIVAAIAAFLAGVALAGAAGDRARKSATCPKCGLRLVGAPASPNA